MGRIPTAIKRIAHEPRVDEITLYKLGDIGGGHSAQLRLVNHAACLLYQTFRCLTDYRRAASMNMLGCGLPPIGHRRCSSHKKHYEP